MATFKICVFEHQKRASDGKFPVSIRVCWKRQYGYIKTEYYVSEKQINKKTFELKDTYIINDLNTRILKYENIKSQKLGHKIEMYSAKDLAEYFKQNSLPGTDAGIDFVEFANTYIAKLKKKGKESTAGTRQRTLNALIDYCDGRTKIPITEINFKFLSGFEDFLRSKRTMVRKNQFGKDVTTTKKGLSDVSVLDYMTDIRTIFNAAMEEYNDEDMGEIRIMHYPFKKYKIKRAPESEKRSLAPEAIRAIRDLPDTTFSRANLSRDVFMLSFYLAGTNLADIYDALPSAYANGRFSYKRRKTKDRRRDKAYISIRVEPEALPLFEKYKDPSGRRLFSFYSRYSTSHIFSDNIDKGLKKVAELCNIDEPLTSYYARHSMATIARNLCGVSKDDINLLLNHVERGMETTDIYLDEDWSLIDNAVRKVLDLLLEVDDLL